MCTIRTNKFPPNPKTFITQYKGGKNYQASGFGYKYGIRIGGLLPVRGKGPADANTSVEKRRQKSEKCERTDLRIAKRDSERQRLNSRFNFD